ncbi:zinc finger domain-containing protein [Curtobacterium sp. S6]|uniref:zinc finger domain-containing protein n=1 Tax=Curtobacterium sp. S6 TaxID=1479623 RepID=UPI003A5C7DD5
MSKIWRSARDEGWLDVAAAAECLRRSIRTTRRLTPVSCSSVRPALLEWECESSASSIASRLASRLAVHERLNRVESGRYALNVYGREGHPCNRCGTPIVREKFRNRSSHFCPRCQRKR